jgi:methionine sulfoxide reductase heme-binding subunit
VIPSPLWYATRGAGAVSLLMLTAVVVLGIATTTRREGQVWPRFLSARMHRNLSLVTLVFLALHIATAVLDPFAHLGFRDALIPFASSYRALWLGLGVVAAELILALAITSALRSRLSYKTWRVLHWTAYACWPLALLHSAGTGSDVRSGWFMALDVICIGAAFFTLVGWRLAHGWPRAAGFRLSVALSSGLAVVALILWMANGPLAAGWARAAGTPTGLIRSSATTEPAVVLSPTPTGHR